MTSNNQPQLSLHGRIPHNVLAKLASSASNQVEEVGEHIWSIPNENSWNAQTFNYYLFSTSDSGNHLVWASGSHIIILRLDETRKEFEVIGDVNGCYERGEKITAILCLPFFMPSARNSQIFVLAGYNTGCLKIFSETGNLLISQLLDISPIIAIKLRTAIVPTFSLPSPTKLSSREQKSTSQSFNEADEEITILFEGEKVVSIDGKSLWMVLRICVGSNQYEISNTLSNSTGESSTGQGPGGTTSFAYKKWHFEGQEDVVDVVSCGQSQHWTANILDQTFSTTTTALFTSNATARYIAVGSNPMLSYYATTDSSRPFFLAASMVVASKVTSAVYSLAKTLLTATGTIPSASGDVSSSTAANIPPAKTIPLILSLNDSNRQILSIVLSPAAADGKYQLAALTDSLGRVTLIDVEEGEIIVMYKGIRNAQCGWVEAIEDDDTEDDEKSSDYTPFSFKRGMKYSKRIALFLVIYSPLRGIVEIHHMRHGIRVGNFSIGQGWHVVTSVSAPLGISMGGGMGFYEAGRRGCRNAGLAKCFLIGPQGEMKRVHVPFGSAIKKQVDHISVFKNLLRKYEAATMDKKDIHSQELMKTLELITNPKTKLEVLTSLPDLLPPTFHLLATQSSIDSMQMLDSFDFLEFIHDIRDQLSKGIDQDDKKLIRLKFVLRENLLHIYQTLEGWNVEGSDNRDNVDTGLDDYLSVADNETFKQSIKFHFGGYVNTEETKHGIETRGIGPSSFMSTFLLKNLDTSLDNGAFLMLDNKICETKKWQLSDFLLSSLIISTSPNEWIETIRKRIPISTNDWLELFLYWFERTSLTSLINFILKLKNDNSNFLVVLLNDFSSVATNNSISNRVINYCLNTDKIGHALLLLLACQYGNPFVDNYEIDWKPLVAKLENCWNLVKYTPPIIVSEIGLTASNLNKFEKTSLTRITAIKDFKLDERANLKISASDPLLKSDLYWIYRSWTFGQLFKKDTDNTDLLRIAIEQTKFISNAALRNGLLYLIWNSLIIEQISSINTLVEKARKAPKDLLCIKQCGMGVKTIDSFLLSSKLLFETFTWEPEEVTYMSHIYNTMESVISIPDDIESKEAYLNDVIGRMYDLIEIADNSQEIKILNKTLVESLTELIHILLLVFRIEVRMIRPSKLFQSNLSFFNPLFVTKGNNIEGINSNSKMVEERISFLKKLIDKSPNYLDDILWVAKKFELNENDIMDYWKSQHMEK
ncbi:Rab3 GTPase-activating protein regulatory subunit N-terminus-domain-containing protein [Glomus cerebriforme]|uniref:Rab3 GTPase-activating protein regulatory subunit N-terminus-domain-containing protein n=1 Tax=Glomus cerebriforme TaxID=658196 RepID=A0A397T9Z2_9GLOM|nr:Rab3 GTPase-activating protein regulatory subunit N-terminus-domain-containing protein [Glomus cerebriforme]